MNPLDGIDTSAIEELMLVKAEEEQLAERLRRMGDLRSTVSPIVYARVEQDYRQREQALDERARPLKARAREEYRRLQSIHQALEAELETAQLESEEREFRHRIGEYDDTRFAEQTREGAERLAEREQALAAAEALRQRFLAAFHRPEELERPDPVEAPAQASSDDGTKAAPATGGEEPPVPSPAEIAPLSTVAETQSPEEDGVTRPMATTPEPPPPPPLPIPLPDDVEEDGTVILPRRGTPIPDSSAELGATMVLPTARLVGQEEGLEEQFHLGPSVTVGRTQECQIRIARPAVSRRHARLDLAPDGTHVVVDLGSENGTYVNGVRVTEQRLADGDLVAFGTVRFLYKAG